MPAEQDGQTGDAEHLCLRMTWLVPDSMSLAKAMTYGSLAKMEHRCTRSNPSSSLVAPCGLHTAFACILACYLPQSRRHFTAIHICTKWHLRIFLLADIAARHGTSSPADPSLLCKMSETGIEHMPLIDSIVYPENHCQECHQKGVIHIFAALLWQASTRTGHPVQVLPSLVLCHQTYSGANTLPSA